MTIEQKKLNVWHGKVFETNQPQTMKVKDLKPHPLNPKLNPFEKNVEERKDLAKRFAQHYKEHGIPNHNPILICPKTNTIWSGHNRYFTALENEYEEVQISYSTKVYDADEPVESQMTYIEQMNADGKRDESKPGTILNKWHAMADVYTGDDLSTLVEAIDSGTVMKLGRSFLTFAIPSNIGKITSAIFNVYSPTYRVSPVYVIKGTRSEPEA